MPAFNFAVDLWPIYFLVQMAFVFANVWIGSTLLMYTSEYDLIRDVVFHGLTLLLVHAMHIPIRPPMKGVFHCKICHIDSKFTVWDFISLIMHCGFLALCLFERFSLKREFSALLVLLLPIRAIIVFGLKVYHDRLIESEA